MVARRFVAVFYPPAESEVTTRITRVESETFKTEGKLIREPGWLEVYGRYGPTEEQSNALVAIRVGEASAVQAGRREMP